MKRQSLDSLDLRPGRRMRVFFPHGGPIKVMVVTGADRPSNVSRCERDYLLREDGRDPEWVPGWYVAQKV